VIIYKRNVPKLLINVIMTRVFGSFAYVCAETMPKLYQTFACQAALASYQQDSRHRDDSENP
jgi:hypothetical protein